MEKSYLIKQMELYSNAIISFVVLQGLVYLYNFSNSELFNKSVKCVPGLSKFLVVLFLITMVGGAIANSVLGKRIVTLCELEYAELVAKIYRGKFYIIVYFGLLPAGVTYYFGVRAICPD